MPVRNLAIIIITAAVSLLCFEKAERNKYANMFAEAMQIVERDYLDEVEPRDLFEGAMDGMMSRLDEHSTYISQADYQRFQEDLDQEFAGIGIVVEIDAETKLPTVVYAMPGKPADRAGLRMGDQILAINGDGTQGLTINDAVKKMKGKEGESVSLEIRHAAAEQTVEVSITRAIIPIESVLGDTRDADGVWDYRLAENPRIGYIRLTAFGEHSAEELQRALKFGGHSVDALILDVRNDPGGLLKAAVEICDMFIDDSRYEGRIVSTRGRRGTTRQEYTAGPEVEIDKNLPMVVLINGQSASASEILAACLKDHGRAVLIGQRTYGKGTVQNIIQMEGGTTALKLTTASYWRPNGKDIHRRQNVPYKADDPNDWGVRPNKGFEVALTDEQLKQVIQQRRQRDYAEDPAAAVEAPATATEKQPDDQKDGAADQPIDDPQLRKAIEYLEQQINSRP